MKQELVFENWYDIFFDEVRSLKYTGPVDQDSARIDYEKGLSPEEAAESFVKEMND